MTELGRSSSNSHSSPLLRPPPFDKLATETIQEIFSLTCPIVILTLRGIVAPFHLALRLVCKRWHDIVAAHHSLWATFEINPQGQPNPIFASKLRNYLQKSGTHPLRIKVWGQLFGASDEIILHVLDALILHCERWTRIKFCFPLDYRFLQKLGSARDRLPLLQRLSIWGPLDPHPTEAQHLAIFDNAPLLNHISSEHIDRDTARMIALPWHHTARAKVDCFSFGEMQPALEQSQTLTDLAIVQGYAHPSSDPDTPTLLKSPATLKVLQALRVHDGVRIAHLTCPSLKRLEAFDEDASDIHKFLDNSSCALSHLELRGGEVESFGVPIIQHVSLSGLTFLHLDYEWSAKENLRILILDERRLLPALEVLHVDADFDYEHQYDLFESHIRGLQRLVGSRTYDRRGGEGTLSALNSITNSTAVTPLKECHFTFMQDGGKWYRSEHKKLKCLRSFCDSRDAMVVLDLYDVEQGVDPCDINQCYHMDDSGDDSDDSF